ncbi:hypothetical protein [Brenneria uluponensis]|uniref:hypothetical protein n=1 Tax=Brenneria uluponensis TaxID=3057057 RepID=UPI0028E94208|nr:hypothetical protein [Brenneria ulupoensis]
MVGGVKLALTFLCPWPLSISNSQINEIYRELRKEILVNQCPNAAAIMFRVFLEISCDDYVEREKKSGNPVTRHDNNQRLKDEDKLSVKILSVINRLEEKGALTCSPP